MKLTNIPIIKSLLLLLLFTLPHLLRSECSIKFGCLARQKFLSYVTVVSQDGTAKPLRSIFNYKVVYIFTDRIVFYTSTDAGSPTLEPEDSADEIARIEAKVERVVPFGEILLDCGGFSNKLCHAQEYPGIEKINSFKKIQENKSLLPSNADVLCLVLPFFENGYKAFHEKMGYICVSNSKDLYNLITFKNYLSRKIELYQLKMSGDRYNGFNGLLKRKGVFITSIEGKMLPVVAKIFNRGMSLRANEASRKFIQDYSFYQQREPKNKAIIVSHGLSKGQVPETWANGFTSQPQPECCIFFKGESQDLTLCLASKDGESLETATDICAVKIKSYFADVFNSLRGIKFAEAYHELKHNSKKLNNCKADEYKIMKWRAEKTIDYAINVDCKYVMSYVSGDDYTQKFNFCHRNYGDELKLELKLMSLDSELIYNGIDKCVYKNALFSKVFSEKHFNDLMQKAKLSGAGVKTSSFLSVQESDDIDEDDGEVSEIKGDSKGDSKSRLQSDDNKKDIKKDASSNFINFTELQSEAERKGKKQKKGINDYVYSKPKDSYESADVNRMKIFRNTKMSELEQSHTWTPAYKETISEPFNQHAASYGKRNTDEFVSFLGFLRDASYKASRVIAKNDEQKLLKKSGK